MKLSNFNALYRRNSPWFLPVFAQVGHFHGADRGGAPFRLLRNHVRNETRFITFRNWEKLDLSERGARVLRQTVDVPEGRCVEYHVYWHKLDAQGFSEYDCACVAIGGNSVPNPSAGQIITSLIEFPAYHPSGVQDLHFDAVFRVSYEHSTRIGHFSGYEYEVFLCPEGWRPTWLDDRNDAVCQQLQSKGIHVAGRPVAA